MARRGWMTSHPLDPTVDLVAALAEAIDRARDIRDTYEPPAPRPQPTICRCGDEEREGRETPPPVDLRGQDVRCHRSTSLRPCQGCPHAVHVGQMCITHAPVKPSVHLDYYHAQCAQI